MNKELFYALLLLGLPLRADLLPSDTDDSYTTPSDLQIVEEIRAHLDGHFKDVSLDLSNGILTLGGTINTFEELQVLLKTIARFPDIAAVINNVTILHPTPPNYPDERTVIPFERGDSFATVRDRDLLMEIRTLLDEDIYSNIEVHVSHGVVTLTGTVVTRNDENFLLQKLKIVDGIQGVVNKVEVLQPPTPH